MQGLCEDAYSRYNLITRGHMCSAGDMPNSEQFGGWSNDQTVGSEVGLFFMALGLANSLELSRSISLNDVLNTMVTMFGRWWRLHLQSLLSLLMKPRFVSFPWLFFYALRFFQVLFIDPLCRKSPFHTLILSILVAVGQWPWRQWIGNASGSCPILLEIQCRAIEDPPRGGRLWGGYHTSFKIPSFLSKYLVVMGSWPRFHLAQPC